MMKKIKVLMISKALVSSAYHKKLEEISALGVQLEVVVPNKWRNQYPEIASSQFYYIHKLPIILSGKNHFHFYLHIEKLIDKIEPDIIHVDEESFSFVTFQVLRIAKKKNIPLIFFNWQNINKKFPWPFSFFERYAFLHASSGIAGNEEAKEVLLKKGCQLPLFVIPQFGVDTQIFIKQPQIELKKQIIGKSNGFVIGYCGRFVEEKGILDLISACSMLPKSVFLVLVGGGPLKETILQRAVKIGFIDRLRIIDTVFSNKMPSYLNILDCLVLPSHTRSNWKEQFGRVLIEAMACEVPVVGSNSGEIPNVIGDAGLIFQEKDIDSLRDAIEQLYNDKTLRAKLGRKGRARVKKYFTQQNIARETVRVYKKVLQ